MRDGGTFSHVISCRLACLVWSFALSSADFRAFPQCHRPNSNARCSTWPLADCGWGSKKKLHKNQWLVDIFCAIHVKGSKTHNFLDGKTSTATQSKPGNFLDPYFPLSSQKVWKRKTRRSFSKYCWSFSFLQQPPTAISLYSLANWRCELQGEFGIPLSQWKLWQRSDGSFIKTSNLNTAHHGIKLGSTSFTSSINYIHIYHH